MVSLVLVASARTFRTRDVDLLIRESCVTGIEMLFFVACGQHFLSEKKFVH